jgi:hypothetical protein
MTGLLATDPGAWSIIGWIVVFVIAGSAVLWVVSALLLGGGRIRRSQSGPGEKHG